VNGLETGRMKPRLARRDGLGNQRPIRSPFSQSSEASGPLKAGAWRRRGRRGEPGEGDPRAAIPVSVLGSRVGGGAGAAELEVYSDRAGAGKRWSHLSAQALPEQANLERWI
jgi:hypothetical protein